MSYRGDYMGAGDYFRGDPGLFGGIAKLGGGLLKTVAPSIPLVGPLSKVALALGGAITHGGKGVLQKARMLSDPFYAKAVQAQAAAATAPIGSSPSGTIHGGKIPKLGPKEHMQLVSGHRHHRRINPGNFKALARAERRVKRFVDKATKLIRWVHPHKAGHAVPRFHKRRKHA